MQKQDSKIMQDFIDKLIDHLPMQQVTMLVDNGFDQWETIMQMKGLQLIDLGYDTQQCIIIMVAANANAVQNQYNQIFSAQKMQQIIEKAKQNDRQKQQRILKQQNQRKKQAIQLTNSNKSIPANQQIKQYPYKDMSQPLLLKGTFTKAKTGQKVNLSKVAMMNLQQKQLTHITNLNKCPNLVNLHLENNYIYKIEGLNQLTKLKVLKLQQNNISKIQGLQNLTNLQYLYLTSNYISRLENITRNQRLQQLYISKQKINTNFIFDLETTQALSYSLQKLQCKQNKINSITQLKYLKVVKEVNLQKNQLSDVGQLAETISGMENLKILSFKQNPLTKSQKYRDYIVILSKTLEQLDGKKILEKQREYLVKLYALKHAKQAKQQSKPKADPNKAKQMNLQGMKMQVQQQQPNYANINRATDLRGNVPYANTKHINKR